MNVLVIGSNKEPITKNLPDKFLYIDDEIPLSGKLFDVSKHSFNPLRGMDYRRRREFVTILDAVFPEGKNTLTRRYSNFALMDVLERGGKLSKLFRSEPDRKDTGAYDAYLKIKDILRSPVLERILDHPTNFSFKGTVLARLNRAELGDFDCYVLGNLLISQYPGPVVIPDFGFYQSPAHSKLLRQKRLIAGINSFDQVPNFKNDLLLVENKIGSRCTPQDAEILATYEGLVPDPTRRASEYNEFIRDAISGESFAGGHNE
jgi:hypothetical protein